MYRPQIDLTGVTALAATNYTKKPNVFRLKLLSGGEYLFHAKDEVQPCIARCIGSYFVHLGSAECDYFKFVVCDLVWYDDFTCPSCPEFLEIPEITKLS